MSYSFSYEPSNDDSLVVAKISNDSKKDKGKLIYLNDSESDLNDVDTKLELFYHYAKHKKIKQSDYDEIIDAIERDESPENKRLKIIYDGFKNEIKKSNEHIFNSDMRLEIIPDSQKRESILISGANGSGKSVFVGAYAEKFNKMFPKSPIFLLSNKRFEDEPAFKKLKNVEQIMLNKKNLIQIIGTDEFKSEKKIAEEMDENSSESEDDTYAPYEYFVDKSGQSLCIFDDFESDGKIESMVRTIINSILRVGRSKRVYCLIVSHTLCGGQKTKTFFTECDAFVLFLKSGISPYHSKYCLKNYTSMNETQIAKVIDTMSRWSYIHKHPRYVVEEHKLYLY